jgi:hypothetical protein
MRRKKRFTIRLVALGFAVAAISAPVAQAIPEGMDGSDLRAIQSGGGQLVVSPDDRAIHGTNPQLVISPDDRPSPRTAPVQPAQPVSATDDSGFDLSTGALGGIVLALIAAMMIGYSVLHVRRTHKPASV